jgi:histidinol dehydrogenase
MADKKIQKIVEQVIASVRKDGDRALVRLAKRFDGVTLTPSTIRVPRSEIKGSLGRITRENRQALIACAKRIRLFHEAERKRIPGSWAVKKGGVRLGQIFSPIASVGIYVPGGRFSYPSTLLMTAIPARLAGVKRIAVVTPPARLSDEILAAASLAGVDEIYQVGGPGALAALAVGTKVIPKVDFILGPGNALVTEAKRQLFGEVGIDLLAGPSELVVVADDSASVTYIAADMAAQAEHDPDSRSYLVATSKDLLSQVKSLLPSELLKRCEFEKARDLADAARKANERAGEHVEILVKDVEAVLKILKNGGAIFIGPGSPAVMGDYWAGPSHVLPTGRSARFGSGLSVLTFLKHSSLIEISDAAYRRGWQSAHQMAEMEGLSQHAHSLRVRRT